MHDAILPTQVISEKILMTDTTRRIMLITNAVLDKFVFAVLKAIAPKITAIIPKIVPMKGPVK